MKLYVVRIDNDMDFPDNQAEYEYFVAENWEEVHKKATDFLEDFFGEGSFEIAEANIIDGYHIHVGEKVPTVTRPVIGGIQF